MRKGRKIAVTLTPEEWALVRQAAALSLQSPGRFLRRAAQRQAEAVLKQIPVRRVFPRAMKRILTMLERPPKPNRALQSAARLHRGAFRRGGARSGNMP